MKTSLVRSLLIGGLLLALVPVTQAQNLNDIRGRMAQRVSQVDTLKSKGVLGENNRGFLDVRSGDDAGVSASENADRALVYAALAKQTGATPAAVGQARAKQIYASSAKGVWVQSANGEWLQK